MAHLPFAVIMFIAIITGPVTVWLMDKLLKPNQSRVRATLFMVACAAASVLTVWILSHGANVILN